MCGCGWQGCSWIFCIDVTTIKNAAAEDVTATCEVGISVDDFLWIYSGKASSSDILKLFYSGRLSISGYAFRKASAFAQSFDFSSDRWTKFYAWRDKQQDKLEQTRSAELTGAHTLTRDHWLLHCRTILKRYNIPRLQRMQWEASLASMFGEKYVLDKVYSDTAGHNLRALTCSEHQPQQPQQFFSVIGSVVAPNVAATWKTMHPPGLGQQHETALQRQLAQFLHPCPKHTTKYANSVCVDAHKDISEMFAFFDENYVHQVKSSAKHRVRQQQLRNRVDLGDAGMQQLDKLVQMIGKGGHSNHKQMNTSKYVPAPEVLLREFRLNATVVVDAVKEKVLGRKSLDKIPAPSMDWWIYGSRTNLLVVDESKQTHLASEPLAVKSVIAANTQAGMVEVERRPTYHRRGSRKRDLAKKHLQAKLESLSRDLVKPPSLRTVNVEDHLVMSDYL